MRIGMLVGSEYRTALRDPIQLSHIPSNKVDYRVSAPSGKIHPANFGSGEDLISSRILDFGGQGPWDLVEVIGGKLGLGTEIIYYARNLAYLSLLMKYGQMSWAPWVVGLVIEISSAALSTREQSKKKGVMEEEYLDRISGALEYIWRKPFFDKVSSPVMEKAILVASKLPALNILSGKGRFPGSSPRSRHSFKFS